MNTQKIFLTILILLWGVFPSLAQAQPTIITFTADIEATSLAGLEQTEQEITLQWDIVGLNNLLTVQLHKYFGSSWVAVEDIPANEFRGEASVRLQHPANFGEPTFRLSIVNQAGDIVTERMLIIPYVDAQATDVAPEITTFELITPSQIVSEQTIEPVPVIWEIQNRSLISNIRFEQMINGIATIVELPRNVLWIPSTGEGTLLPEVNPDMTEINLRMQVYNVITNEVYDEEFLDIALEQSPSTEATPDVSVPVADQPVSTNPQIHQFAVSPNPAERNSIVDISWQAENVDRVTISWVPNGWEPEVLFSTQESNGTVTARLTEVMVYNAVFTIEGFGNDGSSISDEIVVNVNCPYTYYVNDADRQAGTCPETAVQTVQSTYQTFENGFMIHDTQSRAVLVFYNNRQVHHYPDYWAGEALELQQAAPEGLRTPNGAMLKVWTEQSDVATNLGWATAEETPYTAQKQQISSRATTWQILIGDIYFTLPDGRVIRYTGANSTPAETWSFVTS